MKEIILTNNAPTPIGPYSQAVRCAGLVFVSGQIPIDPITGNLVKGMAAETRQALENLKAVLEAAGSSLEQVVKTTVFLRSMDDFAEMNQVYSNYFPDHPPARSCIQVGALPRGVGVEIEAVAEV